MKKIVISIALILMPLISHAAYDSALTVSSTAVQLNNRHWNFTECNCRCESYNIRWWADGSTPTDTSGILLKADETLTLYGQEIKDFKGIRVTSDATLNCHCR